MLFLLYTVCFILKIKLIQVQLLQLLMRASDYHVTVSCAAKRKVHMAILTRCHL